MEKEIKLINREASIFITSEIEGAEISKIIDLYYQINDNSKGFQYKASEVTSLLGISTAELRKKLRSYKLDIKIIKSQRCELCKKSLQYVNLTRTDLSGFLISGRDSRKSWDFVLENTNYRKISVPSQLYMKYEHCNECILSNKTMHYSNQWNIFRQEQEEYQKKKDIEDAKQKYNIDLIRKEIKTLPKIPTGNKDVDKLLRGGFEVNGIHLIAGTSPSNSYSFLLGIVCDLIENGYKIKFLTHSKGEINVKNDILLRAGNMELHNLNSLDFYRSSKVVRIIEAFEQKSIEVLWGYNSTLEKLENLLWDNSCILIIDSIQELRTSEKNKNFLASRDEEFAESLKRVTSMG